MKYHKGNFEGKISLSSKAISEIHRWINNIDNSCHHISNIPNPDITIYTDASLTGLGITNDSSTLTLQEPSTISKTPVNGDHRNATTVKILEASLRQSTQCKYNNYIKHWLHVLDFLSAMFEKGHAYLTINSAKCAIATIVHILPLAELPPPFIKGERGFFL